MDDSNEVRRIIAGLVPQVTITGTPKPSGQRLVYFVDIHDAVQQAPCGPAVLKISKGASARAIAYLQKEIDVLRQLNSPHFPTLYYNDAFSHDPDSEEPLDERFFITIEERIHGNTLAAVKRDYQHPKAALEILIQLVTAASTLWSMRPSRVHRDIKPDNIMIREDSQVCLIDLGILREEGDRGTTATAAPHGPCTPCYSSPEQANNDKKNISFKSDIFSIGVVGYELISGENPYCNDKHIGIEEVFEKILTSPPKPLSEICGVDEDVSNIINCMLMRHPYQRPRSPQILIKRLREILENKQWA